MGLGRTAGAVATAGAVLAGAAAAVALTEGVGDALVAVVVAMEPGLAGGGDGGVAGVDAPGDAMGGEASEVALAWQPAKRTAHNAGSSNGFMG